MKACAAKGFTLIEVLVVMALAALLLAVAVPNLRPQVAEANARSVAGDIADALRYARQYALNTSGVVTFTPSGCNYSVATTGGTQLLSGSSSTPSGVSCSALGQALSFLGDGTVTVCSSGSSGTTCTAPTVNQVASVSGGGQTWQITVSPGGVITTTAP